MKKRWINNGKIETTINEKDDIPKGFVLDKLKKVKTKQFYYVNNGVENLKVEVGSSIPNGYVLGLLGEKHWYTNGVDSVMSVECPKGYWRGRAITASPTADKVMINNGVSTYFIPKDVDIPKGFKKGNIKTTKGYRTYNNGVDCITIHESEKVPDGYVLGRLKTEEEFNRRSKGANSRRIKWINNNFEELKIPYLQEIPKGYVEGRLTKERKKELRDLERDKYYEELGYLPLNRFPNLYNAYVYLRDEIDKIMLPETKVYFHKKHLDMLEEYSKQNHSKGTSLKEQKLVEYIKSIEEKVLVNTKKIITPLQLDAYVENKKVAFEFNGNYWHSSEFLGKNYHIDKTNKCKHLGIRLIHIFEYQYDTKKDIMLSIINSSLGKYERKIYARSCVLGVPSKEEVKEFLNKNHIQGFINSSYQLGLYYNRELVQLICIGKSRFKKNDYELYRMCTKLNTQVVGGFSKLLKNQPYDELYSYIDLSKFTGDSYFKIGFDLVSISPPSYVYVRGNNIYSRFMFQKHKLKDFLDKFDENLSEEENARNNHYYRIYDCGTMKVKWSRVK